VKGLLPVAALRFRGALAGGVLRLLPLHFVLALALSRSVPGTTDAARVQAADAAALALAAVLGLVAAAVLGGAPLAEERERARGTLVLAAPVPAAARVLGTALGTGAALLLLVLGLGASAVAAVDLGAGAAPRPPRAYDRAISIEGGEPDPREEGLVWLTEKHPRATVHFGLSTTGPALGRSGRLDRDCTAVLEARPRLGGEGGVPGVKRAVRILEGGGREVLRAPLTAPFRTTLGAYEERLEFERAPGGLDLGLPLRGLRVEIGTRPRAGSRLLHVAPLFAGLLAVMAAATALSTFAGGGVAAAGALALALLSLFRQVFVDAASTLAYAGAMEKAVEAEHGGHARVEALSATPPAMAPLFRALAGFLPDGTRFDLGAVVAAGEVPDPGDAGRAVLLGGALAAGFLVLAVLGARRRP